MPPKSYQTPGRKLSHNKQPAAKPPRVPEGTTEEHILRSLPAMSAAAKASRHAGDMTGGNKLYQEVMAAQRKDIQRQIAAEGLSILSKGKDGKPKK